MSDYQSSKTQVHLNQAGRTSLSMVCPLSRKVILPQIRNAIRERDPLWFGAWCLCGSIVYERVSLFLCKI